MTYVSPKGSVQPRREWLSSLARDIVLALRGVHARPAFTAAVLVTLALGVGANATIFSVVHAVLLRPLPYGQPDRLVDLWETFDSKVDRRSEASYPDYLDWRARNHSFADLGGYEGTGFLVGGARPDLVVGVAATANLLDVLGVHPLLGRGFVAGEDAVGAPAVALVTYGFWRQTLAGDSAIVGRSITLNGTPTTVVGVLPRSFRFDRIGDAAIWVPTTRGRDDRARRGNHWLNVIARLEPGVTPAKAARDLSAIMRDLAREYPETNAGRDGQVVPLQKEIVGSVEPQLVLLYGAVILLLVIACVNVANLLLIRGTDREREMAVRMALGAGRARLVRQLLTESLALGIVGGLLGLGLARLGLTWLTAAIPESLERQMSVLRHVPLDSTVVMYGVAMSIGAGVAFGIVPALRTTSGTYDALKSGGRGSSRAGSRLRDALVVSELALTAMLLSASMLFGKSLVRLLAIDPGVRPQHLLTGTVVLPPASYPEPAAQVAAFARLTDRLRAVPGVEGVGLVSRLPLNFGNSMTFDIIGQPAADASREPTASLRQADPGYFATAGVPILRGRSFTTGDQPGTPTAVIANRALVRAYFGDADPIGKRLYAFKDTLTIVGEVGDVAIGGIDQPVPPTLYVAFARLPQPFMGVVIRTNAAEGGAIRGLRVALAAVDPAAAVTGVAMMSDVIGDSPSVFLRRYPLYVIGAFAATALVLAIVGIYGVVSYAVSQRTREMGIRMALGAPARNLAGLALRHGAGMAVIGIALGIVGAVVAGRSAASMLYGVTPTDPGTYASVAVALGLLALAATALPARRATRVDPAVALRAE